MFSIINADSDPVGNEAGNAELVEQPSQTQGFVCARYLLGFDSTSAGKVNVPNQPLKTALIGEVLREGRRVALFTHTLNCTS